MNVINLNSYHKHEARRRRHVRDRQRRGLGWMHVCEMPLPAYEGARVLNHWREWDEEGEGYTIYTRVKLPRSIVSMGEGWRHRNARIGAFLSWCGLIDESFCQHAYDCCANFYPSSPEVIELRGRVILFRQHYTRNI